MLGGVLIPVVTVLGAYSIVSDWVGLTLQIPPVAFLAVGMVGLRIRQKQSLGRLGQAGFVLATSAAAYSVGILVFALHTLYTGGLKTMMPTIVVLFGVSVLMLILGSVLLGIASLHAEVLPRWAALLLIIGGVAAAVPFIGVPLFGAGWTAIGYALWSEGRKGLVTRTRRIGVLQLAKKFTCQVVLCVGANVCVESNDNKEDER